MSDREDTVVLHAWVGGSDPGPMLVEVDPVLEVGDVEISLDGMVDDEWGESVFGRVMTPTAPISQSVLDELVGVTRRKFAHIKRRHT